MKYPDIIKLATVIPDGYGDETVTAIDEIPASFIKRHGYTHSENTEGETSDAAVYLLPTHASVLENIDQLEGMYVHSAPYSDDTWYRISSVNVAERKLLNNTIDNVYCRLEKVAGLPYVPIS